MLETGLGQPVDEIFEWLSEEPLAAASLGQVYRGRVREELGGQEVAVKIQRPGVLERCSMDIFILRRVATLLSLVPGMSGEWAGALDDWAARFFEELDYQLEASNTIAFKKSMERLEVRNKECLLLSPGCATSCSVKQSQIGMCGLHG